MTEKEDWDTNSIQYSGTAGKSGKGTGAGGKSFYASLVEKIANVLADLRVWHAWIAHDLDGLDEISPIGETKIAELKDGWILTYSVYSEDFGQKRAKVWEIEGGSAEENARIVLNILKG